MFMISPAETSRRLTKLQDGLPKVAKVYEGTAVLAPSAADLARAAGISQNDIPKGGEGIGWTFRAITGLEEIHRGLILGDPANVRELNRDSLPAIDVDVEDLAERINALPEEARIQLLGRFAAEQA